MRGGLAGVLPLLACPHCADPLARPADGVVGCGNGHRFDVSRQGYLSLLGKGSRTDTGDSADMVEARMAFLGAGHYRQIADEVAGQVADQIAAETVAGPVLEIGAGTGYYLGIAVGRPGARLGIALDASRYAARRAAVAHPRIGSVVADAWSRLPILDGAVSTVLSVFAPRHPGEISRVLAPGGRLVAVTPEPDHLAEIREALGLLTVDPGKPERLVDAFAGLLEPIQMSVLRRDMHLTRDEVSALVRMGPTARHLDPSQFDAAIAGLAEVTMVTSAVTVSILAG